MKLGFKNSFAKDLKAIDKGLANRLRKVIEEIERAKSHAEITNLKKIRGTGNYYRVRIGDYRVGIMIAGERRNSLDSSIAKKSIGTFHD